MKPGPSKHPRFARIRPMPRWTERGHALRAAPARRGWWRGLPGLLAVLVLFAGALWLAARLDPLPPRFSGIGHASDGDSFRIGPDRIRLVGLDAPELDQVCWRDDGAEWPCGRAARDLMARELAEGPVACAPLGEDRYGRTLARCTVAAGGDLGAALVEAGLAVADGGYLAEQAEARRARRGLWSGRFASPRDWREEGPSSDPGPGPLETLWHWLRELTGARTLR